MSSYADAPTTKANLSTIVVIMIPPVSVRDVKAALKRIALESPDKRRSSTKFCLVVDRRHFPPKYTVSLAVEQAHGRPLKSQEFSGGAETNALLASLGFEVVECSCGGTATDAGTSIGGGRPDDATSPNIPETHTIGRVIVVGKPPDHDTPATSERILVDALNRCWPKNAQVKFLITPGGFVKSNRWPSKWAGKKAWESRPSDVVELIGVAEGLVKRVVTKRVLAAALGKTDVLTVGVDLFGDGGEHIELVAVFDVDTGSIARWTGKSYPTSGQERTLVQVVNLDTHLLRIAGERVLVLGCHDLNMFSPRGHAAQDPNGHRRRVCDAMAASVLSFQPTVVLQHPHTTDTPNIWRMPWLSLQRSAPSVKAWASGIGYYNWGRRRRAPLDRVLELTRKEGEPTLDIKIRASDFA